MVQFFTRLILSFYLLVFCLGSLSAQVISGMLNYTQTHVTAIAANNAELTLTDATGFAIGDRVLLIQVQGATINTSNNSSFGDIQNYNGAGSYEIVTVCETNGNLLTLENELLNSFDPSFSVQAIKIPQYGNLTINGSLTAPEWNGSEGGVLVLEAVSIDLLGNIDMSEKGFRGGVAQNSNLTCNWITIFSGFAYGSPDNGAEKGEGIALMSSAMSYGKGAAGNGGGGGNDHNSGGAGGGNISAGGQGGTNGSTGFFDCKGNHPGVGGKGQVNSDQIFLGGGGGAGHGNNGLATSGGNGGGIIILIAQSMTGNNVFIRSNGETALNTSYDMNDPGGDGAGGGGAGGAVHLDIPTITGNITIEAIGGNGGDVVHTESTNDCFGPGGGGAGGTVKFSGSAPGSVTTTLTQGSNGTNEIMVGTSSCIGSSQNAASGQPGQVFENEGSVPVSTTDFPGCNIQLAVELIDFSAKQSGNDVELSWTTLTETNNAFFVVEKSKDAILFETIAQVEGAGTTSERIDYFHTDEQPYAGQNYYRIKMIDHSGQFTYSEIRTVRVGDANSEEILVYPNPVKHGDPVIISFFNEVEGPVLFEIIDLTGRIIYSENEKFSQGRHTTQLDITSIGTGTFFVKVESNNYSTIRKIVKLR